MAFRSSWSERKESVAIGIDFGSSKCCVAAVRDGRAHVLENEFGQRTTPSWVAFNSQQRLVGGAALDQAVVNCANTVSGVKRTLGVPDEELRERVSKTEGTPMSVEQLCTFPQGYESSGMRIRVSYRRKDIVLFPEEIAAALLSKMKSIVEKNLECTVSKAVVAVPASFNNHQRRAVKMAAEVAGLEDVSLINEPTAVALAYASNSKFRVTETIIVVDIGAGKLEVSLIGLRENAITVHSTSGNVYFGGHDLDMELLKMCVEKFMKAHDVNLWNNRKALIKLLKACQNAKLSLSLLRGSRIYAEEIISDHDFEMTLSREDFENLCLKKLKQELREHILICCAAVNREINSVDQVVLVGGSTRIPGVREYLMELFNKNLCGTVNAVESVAYGAALAAKNRSEKFLNIMEINVLPIDVVPTYLTPFTLVPHGVRLPYKETKLLTVDGFTTINEYQHSSDFSQAYYAKLGSFSKKTSTNDKSEQLKVTVSINDVDGAAEINSFQWNPQRIRNNQSRTVMIERAQAFEKDAAEIEELDGLACDLVRFCTELKQTSTNSPLKNKCSEVQDWLEESPEASREDYLRKKAEIESLARVLLENAADAMNPF